MSIELKSAVHGIYLWVRKKALRTAGILRKNEVIIKKEIQNILFIRHDRIGDMVLSTAAVRALRKGYPRAKITILASERNRDILKHNPYVDEVLIYKGISWFVREMHPRRYDLVIDPFMTYELKQALMAYLSRGTYRIGFEGEGREIFFNLICPMSSPSKQMVDHLLDLAQLAGGKREGCEPQIFLSGAEKKWASKTLIDKEINTNQLTIGIHPGAHYPSQRWATGRFGELARRILQQGKAKIILLGSHAETRLLEEVKKNAGVDIPIFSCDNIREFMALLSRCNLFVCNNSGPLHIASALKVPTVSMVGPTVTPLWLPYGRKNVVINKALFCSPCNKAVCKDHECMELITVVEVFEAVQKQIASIGPKRMKRFSSQKEIIKRNRS
jgi:heptosyltransferase-2